MRKAVILAASILALAVAEDRPQAEPHSRHGGHITAIVGESGDFGPSPRLIVMDADGTNPRVFNWIWEGSPSPDGRSIAFRSRNGERIPTIRVMAITSRRSSRLLVRNGTSADWSPRGKAIAFNRGHDVWVKDLQKSEQRRIVRNAAEPDWSGDGRKLAFVRGNDVWIVDLASKRTRRLIRDAHAPHWSPDGSHIAFERSGDVRTQIYIADDDGRNQQRVAVAESPAWSPDGHELAASEFSRIIRIRLDGTHRRVVYSGRAGRHDDCCAYREIEWVAG